jgi:hypothetical protein
MLIDLDYNLEDVSSSIEPVPAQTYVCRIDKAELTESSTKKPMLKFEWKIIDGEYAGRTLFDNVVTSVSWKVKQYAELAGIESGKKLNTEDFVGIEAVLTISVKQREDDPEKQSNRIEKIEAM